MKELLSLRDCARRFGIAPHELAYAHEMGYLPDVECRVAGKRIYTPQDVRRVAAYFGIELNKEGRPNA